MTLWFETPAAAFTMDSISTAMLLLLLALICLLLTVSSRDKGKLPPGPRPLPLLGNLLLLRSQDMLTSLTELSKEYGSVYTVYLGSRRVVVLSGFQAVKEALVDQGEEFSGRGDYPVFFNFTKGNDPTTVLNRTLVPIFISVQLQPHFIPIPRSPANTSSTFQLSQVVPEPADHLNQSQSPAPLPPCPPLQPGCIPATTWPASHSNPSFPQGPHPNPPFGFYLKLTTIAKINPSVSTQTQAQLSPNLSIPLILPNSIPITSFKSNLSSIS
ncbi:hypothetical protein P7K49_034425 [Saguinus oedipus]|uniref:Uncharacterized protein n=1 Tax=Saguinus oedipus TaxID=9490 RepID=A0ABQ9TUP8_SAGOE|nr:hypothetical protein P7K49_034425 [Saguinus oedipus]